MKLFRKLLLLWILVIFCINILPGQNCSNNSSTWASNNENPFKTYYADPDLINDMIIDSKSNTMYIGCEYGVIIKNLTTNKYKVISYFDGLESRYVEAIELDKENSRLFILGSNSNDVFVLNVKTLEIVEKFILDSTATLADAAEFKHLLFIRENNILYLTSDAGLAELNLTTKKFTFFDIFFFDVNFSKYEKTKNKVCVETDELFTINGLDYNLLSKELYIATPLGLTIFNMESKDFINYRNDSKLAGYLSDVLFEEKNNWLFLAKETLIKYNLKTDSIFEYPSIRDKRNYDANLDSLAFDSKRDLIYAFSHNHISTIIIFDGNNQEIIKTFNTTYNTGEVRPITRTFPNMYYHESDDEMYLGLGEMRTLDGSTWKINYTITKKSRVVKTDNSEYLYWETNKKLDYKRSSVTHSISSSTGTGLVLFSYDFNSDKFSLINITNNVMIGEDYCKRNKIKVHPKTGTSFIFDNDNLLLFNSNGKFITSIDKNINDIEFQKDLAYLATSDGLHVMDLNTFEINNVTLDNSSYGIASIECGQKSQKLYLTSKNKIIVFDPELSSMELLEINETLNHIAIDKNEEIAFIGNHREIYKLYLGNGTYELFYPYNDPLWGIQIVDISEVVYCPNLDIFIFNNYHNFLSTNETLKQNLVNGNSVASIFMDQDSNNLYYITGYFDNDAGCSLEWSGSSPLGLMVYNLQNNTQHNYSIEHGLPSEVLISVAYDPIRNNIHLVGERFYSIVNKAELEKNITRKKTPSVIFRQTESARVVGFEGEDDYLVIYIGIAGISIMGSIGFSLFMEPSKYKLMLTFASPLYTRLRKGKILKHETRGRIREKIESQPGTHYNELKKSLKLKNGALAYHLKVLEREGLIKSKNIGRYKHFFPGTMILPKKFFKMNEIQKIIFKKLIETPGLSQKKITSEIGSSTSTVNYNINILKDRGIVDVQKEGSISKCYIIQENGETADDFKMKTEDDST